MAAASNAPASWNADPDPLPGQESPDRAGDPLVTAALERDGRAPPQDIVRQGTKLVYHTPTGDSDQPSAPSPTGSAPASWNADPDPIGEKTAAHLSSPQPPGDSSVAHAAGLYLKGLTGEGLNLVSTVARGIAASGAGLAAAEDPDHADVMMETHKLLSDHIVAPVAAVQQKLDIPADAPLSDELWHNAGQLTAMMAEIYLTGGLRAGAAVTSRLVASGVRPGLARAAGGVAMMQTPAVAHGVAVGSQVMDRTGDINAAFEAGATAYAITALSGAAPMSVGAGIKSPLLRVGARGLAGGGVGVGLQEAGRVAQNAAMPDDMQQPFSVKQDLAAGIPMALLGLLPAHAAAARAGTPKPGAVAPEPAAATPTPTDALGSVDQQTAAAASGGTPPGAPPFRGSAARDSRLAQHIAQKQQADLDSLNQRVITEAPETVLDMAPRHAAEIVAEHGGDALSQQVAASSVAAHIGGVHDAAAVQGARERRAASQDAARQEMENEQALIDQGQQDQAGNAQKGAEEDAAYAQRDWQQQQQRDADTTAARNQVGDQAIQAADTANTGADRGTAGAPLPTLADALTPEQVRAFQTLKDRRTAEMAQPQPAPEPSVVDQELPPAAPPKNRLDAIRQAAQKRAQVAEPTGKAADTTAPAGAFDNLVKAYGPDGKPIPVKVTAGKVAAKAQEAMAAGVGPKDIEPISRAVRAGTMSAEDGNAALQKLINGTKEEDAPEGNPPPVTPKTFAERKQAVQDAQLAAKIGRPAPTESEPVTASKESAAAPTPIEAPASAGNGTLRLRRATAGADTNGNTAGMHGQSPAEQQVREAEFSRDAAYKQLMAAKPDDVGALVNKMSPEDAQAHLDRLDSAPGDNPAAREALEARVASNEVASEPQQTNEAQVEATREPAREEPTMPPTDREELPASPSPTTFGERRQARQAKQAQRRMQFADAVARIGPEDVQHTGENGEHTAVTPNGTTHAVETADGNLRITRDDTSPGMRGRGEAVARAERLAQEVHATGGKLTSDASVSPEDARTFEALQRRGYDVQRNPNTVRNEATGNLASDSPRTPVYTVGPKKDPAAETGLQLRRRAEAGDQSASEELARRQSLANEPRAPAEGGALAARRGEARDTEAPEEGALAARRRDAAAQDAANQPRLTKAQGEAAIKPLLDRLPGATGVTVHESANADTVPQHIKDALRPGSRNENAPAAYDRQTDTVHLIADRHSTPEQIQRKAIHEIVGHQGMSRLLGPDFDKTMADIAKKADARGKAWMEEYTGEKELNLKDPAQAKVAAEEWAAHLAEFPEDHPGAWQRIVDAVRAGLRKIPGLGRHMEWTEGDIRALVRKSESGLRIFNPRVARLQDDKGSLRFARADDESYAHLPPDHPDAVNGKLGRADAEQENYNKGTIRSLEDWGRTVEEQMPEGYKDGTSAKATEMYRAGVHRFMGAAFLHNLEDFLNLRTRPIMKSVPKFSDVVGKLEGGIGKALADGGKIATDWDTRENQLRKQTNGEQGGEVLADLIHDSTRGRNHASKEYVPVYGKERVDSDPEAAAFEEERKAQHKELQARFNALDPKDKELYNTVFDHYERMGNNELAGLEKRIKDTQASDATKEKHISLLRKKFQIQRGLGPYAPLAHEGPYWAVAKKRVADSFAPMEGQDKDSRFAESPEEETVSAPRFATYKAQQAWIAEAEKMGLGVTHGQDLRTEADRKRLDPKFASEIADMAKDISPEFAEDVWQHYLRSMPETGGVKNLPRQGRPGYTRDALYNFKNAVRRNALVVARLNHGQELANVVDAIQKEAQEAHDSPNTTKKDKLYTHALAQEFALRHAMIADPKSAGPLASAAVKLGWGWYLAYAPATALRIIAQNFTLARPQLGAKFGELGSTREMTRANELWLKSTASKGDSNANYIDRLRDDGSAGGEIGERKAHEDTMHQGLIGNTWAKSMMQGGARAPGEVSDAGGRMSRYAANFLKSSGWLFDKAEQRNRLTTFTAAYRLGMQKNLAAIDPAQLAEYKLALQERDPALREEKFAAIDPTVKTAIDDAQESAARVARNLVKQAHVPYGLSDRPRWLQGSDTARVVGQFKLFGLTVASGLIRQFRNATRNLPGFDKGVSWRESGEAAQALGWTLGRAMLLGGIYNLPGRSLVSGVTNFYHHHFTDDDKFDFNNSIKQHLTQWWGKRFAGWAMHGPASEETGYNLSSAADYNNLFWKNPEEDMSYVGLLGNLASQGLGSPAGIGLGAAQGADIASGANGDAERGLEHVLPTELANVLKALRFVRDKGALNGRDEMIAPMSTTQALARAGGLSTQTLTNQYETNTGFHNARQRIEEHRKALVNAWVKAAKSADASGDETQQKEIEARIDKFNEANEGNPRAKIGVSSPSGGPRSAKGLAGILQREEQAEEQAVHGVNIKGYEGLAAQFGLTQEEPQ